MITLEVKKFLESGNFDKNNLELKNLPSEEAEIFLKALENLPHFLINLDPSFLITDKNDLQKWVLIYIYLHDLFHGEIIENDLVKLEIISSTSVFGLNQKFISLDDYQKLVLAYSILGLTSLKINHHLPYLISEKIILGEFAINNGIEKGIWGIKLKINIFPQIIKNINEKVNKNHHHLLVKKYKNFIFDFLYL